MKKTLKNLLALGFGIVVSLLILEVFLRFYNPIPTRVKGNKIVLPANQKYEFQNTTIPGLDLYIIHTKNALGFRGEEFPEDAEKMLTIIAVGGSTTECFYLSDGKDWPNVLAKNLKKNIKNTWLNNAGLDGHSTFGHQILLEDHLLKLKPDFVLFLVGVNDIERKDLYKYDSVQFNNAKRKNLKLRLIESSELLHTIYTISKRVKARQQQVGHWYMNVNKVDTFSQSTAEIKSQLEKQTEYLDNFSSRIEALIKTCRDNKITPVFLTQPMLFGDVNDPVTGKYLGNISFRGRSSLAYWQIMQLYNAITKLTCAQKNVTCIDLASAMPKTTHFFYDEVHYTNAGAEKVAQIVTEELSPLLKNYKN